VYYDERPGCFERAFEVMLMLGVLLICAILFYRYLTGL
jgi:hypothetical protein